MQAMPHGLVGVAVALYGSKRLPHLRAELKKHDMSDSVDIVCSHRDTEDRIRGCFRGHQGAITYALKKNPSAKYVFVCEDDVVFDPRGHSTLAAAVWEACSALDTGHTDCVGLGGLCISPMQREVVHSVYMCKWQCAQCYVLSVAAAKKVVEWRYQRSSSEYGVGSHYDQVLSRRLKQSILFPTVAFQRAHYGSEDITTTATGSWIYVAVQTLRNIINPCTPQVFLEYLFYVLRNRN